MKKIMTFLSMRTWKTSSSFKGSALKSNPLVYSETFLIAVHWSLDKLTLSPQRLWNFNIANFNERRYVLVGARTVSINFGTPGFSMKNGNWNIVQTLEAGINLKSNK